MAEVSFPVSLEFRKVQTDPFSFGAGKVESAEKAADTAARIVEKSPVTSNENKIAPYVLLMLLGASGTGYTALRYVRGSG